MVFAPDPSTLEGRPLSPQESQVAMARFLALRNTMQRSRMLPPPVTPPVPSGLARGGILASSWVGENYDGSMNPTVPTNSPAYETVPENVFRTPVSYVANMQPRQITSQFGGMVQADMAPQPIRARWSRVQPAGIFANEGVVGMPSMGSTPPTWGTWNNLPPSSHIPRPGSTTHKGALVNWMAGAGWDGLGSTPPTWGTWNNLPPSSHIPRPGSTTHKGALVNWMAGSGWDGLGFTPQPEPPGMPMIRQSRMTAMHGDSGIFGAFDGGRLGSQAAIRQQHREHALHRARAARRAVIAQDQATAAELAALRLMKHDPNSQYVSGFGGCGCNRSR